MASDSRLPNLPSFDAGIRSVSETTYAIGGPYEAVSKPYRTSVTRIRPYKMYTEPIQAPFESIACNSSYSPMKPQGMALMQLQMRSACCPWN